MESKFSVILETENLGMAGIEDLKSSLNSLKNQSYPIKKAKEVIIIVGGHVSKEAQNYIKKNYPWARIHNEDGHLEYTKAKALGAKLAKGEVIIFVDSDVKYEKKWLENIVKIFSKNKGVDIVGGDTRIETVSGYTLSLNLMWMIYVQNKINKLAPAKYFSLNNFAIKRDLMNKINIPFKISLYRGKIPLWRENLMRNGARIYRAPHTKGYHAAPGNLKDWFYRMLIYGADFVAQADFSLNPKGKIVEKRSIAKRIAKFIVLPIWKIEQIILNTYKLISENTKILSYLPTALVICLLNLILMCSGALIALFNRDFILNRINALEAEHVV